MFKTMLLMAVALTVLGCGPTVGNTRISHKQLCSSDRPKCAPDGEFFSIFNEPRPAIARIQTGTTWIEKWGEHLGRLVPNNEKLDNIQKGQRIDTIPCVALDQNDISYDFSHLIDVTLIKETELRAKLKESIDGALANVDLAEKPKVSQRLEAQVYNKIKENAYTQAHYKVVNVTRKKLDDIALSSSSDGALWACREKIKNKDGFFIRSIAVIESEGRMTTNQLAELSAIVSAELQNAKLNNGGPLQGDVSVNLSLEIASKTERDISTITENHSTVYAYGYWGPLFAVSNFQQYEFDRIFEPTNSSVLLMK